VAHVGVVMLMVVSVWFLCVRRRLLRRFGSCVSDGASYVGAAGYWSCWLPASGWVVWCV